LERIDNENVLASSLFIILFIPSIKPVSIKASRYNQFLRLEIVLSGDGKFMTRNYACPLLIYR
jgi:hypothetical protein